MPSPTAPVALAGASASDDASLANAVDTLASVVLGKEHHIRLALCCLLARGHLLIEDLPGMGKTTLSHSIARVLGLEHRRIQFTSDLLPSDVLGASIFDRESAQFLFVPGPVFTQLLLADEINRTTPKTQSALLEAMEERQVTIDGETRQLPAPFFVIATQNPQSQSGTYALPESQLDRFLMRIELGYPDAGAERQMLEQGDSRPAIESLPLCLDREQLSALQNRVEQVRASDALLDYVQRLVEYSRSAPDFTYGLSPRASLALLQAARAWALLQKRNHVVPEDVQAVLPAVATHRLMAAGGVQSSGQALVVQMLDSVDVV